MADEYASDLPAQTSPAGAMELVLYDPATIDPLDGSHGTLYSLTLTQLAAFVGAGYQPLNSNLTGIAGLDYVTGSVPYYTGAAWATFATTSFGRTLAGSADAAAARTSLGVQPLDATLTALAALTIAANSLTVGTGAGAFSQTTFAANTFPARSSSGGLVAKTITDFGLSLVDDADASAARTTLGLGTLATQSGTFSGTSSGTNTGDQTAVSGNAGTATALQTARTINGTSFDGTANVVIGAIPQNSQSAAYTTVLADAGKHILHPAADTTARNFTIDSNANVAYPVGTTITFANQHGAGVVTIKITADTMRLAGAGTTGDRTLAADGVATALKITSTEWIISGTGLT